MGLDGVEIIMEIEDVFDIRIADEEAERTITVGDAVRLVIAKRFAGRAHGCVGSWAFRRVRKALGGAIGVPRQAVKRRTPLAMLIPVLGRPDHWRRLEKTLGLKLPSLSLSGRLQTAIGVTACAVGALLAWGAAHAGCSSAAWVSVAVIAGIASAIGLELRLSSSADRFDARLATMEGLTMTVLSGNYAVLSDERERFDEREVFAVVREITAIHLGLDPQTILREDEFVKDLAAD